MDDISRNFSTSAIVKAIEENFITFILTYVRAAKGEIHVDRDLTRVYSGMFMSYFNGVIRTRLDTANIELAIERTLAYFKAIPCPMIWWVDPLASPSNLGDYLKAHGLNFRWQDIGMAIDLLTMNEALPVPLGLTIETVKDEKTLQEWLNVYGIGFELSTEVTADYGKHLTHILSNQYPIGPYYLARINGEAVGTSCLCIGASVAGIYEVATLPSSRRKGVGTAVVLAALQEARSKGYKVGVLQASKMGISMYRGLGFREYCSFDAYSNSYSAYST